MSLVHRDQTINTHCGEPQEKPDVHVNVKCTDLHDKDFEGISCGKIVMVENTFENKPNEKTRVYALLDDQSNRFMITPEL